MTLPLRTRPGMSLVVAVLVVGAVALMVIVGIGLRGTREVSAGAAATGGQQALALADGCAEVALYEITQSATYVGATIGFAGGTCAIAVSGNGTSQATVTVAATWDKWTRTAVLVVNRAPPGTPPVSLSIASWRYP